MKNFAKNEMEQRRKKIVAEMSLWERVRNQKTGYKFVRMKQLCFYHEDKLQYFSADFFCPELKLIIEMDEKNVENRMEYEKGKDYIIHNLKYRVVNIPSEAILNNPDMVLKSMIPLREAH